MALSDDVNRCRTLATAREEFHCAFGAEDAESIRNVLAELEDVQRGQRMSRLEALEQDEAVKAVLRLGPDDLIYLCFTQRWGEDGRKYWHVTAEDSDRDDATEAGSTPQKAVKRALEKLAKEKADATTDAGP